MGMKDKVNKRGDKVEEDVQIVIPRVSLAPGGYVIRVGIMGAAREARFEVKVVPRVNVETYQTVFVVEYLRHAHRAPLF
jgi:hypothetical protein